jgi:hypothetical protein
MSQNTFAQLPFSAIFLPFHPFLSLFILLTDGWVIQMLHKSWLDASA